MRIWFTIYMYLLKWCSFPDLKKWPMRKCLEPWGTTMGLKDTGEKAILPWWRRKDFSTSLVSWLWTGEWQIWRTKLSPALHILFVRAHFVFGPKNRLDHCYVRLLMATLSEESTNSVLCLGWLKNVCPNNCLSTSQTNKVNVRTTLNMTNNLCSLIVLIDLMFVLNHWSIGTKLVTTPHWNSAIGRTFLNAQINQLLKPICSIILW